MGMWKAGLERNSKSVMGGNSGAGEAVLLEREERETDRLLMDEAEEGGLGGEATTVQVEVAEESLRGDSDLSASTVVDTVVVAGRAMGAVSSGVRRVGGGAVPSSLLGS
jgi:hypothetical protein